MAIYRENRILNNKAFALEQFLPINFKIRDLLCIILCFSIVFVIHLYAISIDALTNIEMKFQQIVFLTALMLLPSINPMKRRFINSFLKWGLRVSLIISPKIFSFTFFLDDDYILKRFQTILIGYNLCLYHFFSLSNPSLAAASKPLLKCAACYFLPTEIESNILWLLNVES